ncbi:hypothetical protein P7K49_021966 [Saguinus oedipus]|uniref:Uncharacterized protein n=1 Tax=Saguinus oedipus TaxID=9490 RepID=A0ABQ9UU55_SAGOE|nr:hypothetical protein P7K49_021966 [Saguinus oedipus]
MTEQRPYDELSMGRLTPDSVRKTPKLNNKNPGVQDQLISWPSFTLDDKKKESDGQDLSDLESREEGGDAFVLSTATHEEMLTSLPMDQIAEALSKILLSHDTSTIEKISKVLQGN